ncbi:MAG: amidohydrolase family protein [Rhodobacteraceae bacterium]|nr:amidohydrolase family protein [Paracoccaceae bacterium]
MTEPSPDKIQITNCHIHLFTADHTPENFPFAWAKLFRSSPWMILFLSKMARLIGQEELGDTLHRLYQFQQQGEQPTQAKMLEDVAKHYPSDTRFVALPMDMRGIGFGDVPVPLKDQHDELARLRDNPPERGTVIPFATVNPLVPGSVAECKRALQELKFEGLKIYPRMGFPPDHPALMEEIYPLVSELNLPVMTHCSRGGVQGRGMVPATGDRFTRPVAYRDVLKRFGNMRVCLAHFGGQTDWEDYVKARRTRSGENWMLQIREMIESGAYPNLWTDISYTMFHFDSFAPVLKLLLMGDDDESRRLRARTLFGSDFYMTRQEELSERAVCMRLREHLGEDLFRQIAETNPDVWLTGQGDDKSLWTR